MNAPAFRGSPLAMTVLALLHFQPLHPYGIQRLIKQWGKDQVVNVGQRASLYRTIERLLAAQLIAVRETGRDQQYPERTVYELTDEGRATMRVWLDEMLAAPKQEFPQFPAALSFVLMLAPNEALEVLERRAATLAESLAEQEKGLADAQVYGLPRVAMLESEYLRTMTAAELDWVRAVADDLRSARLNWTVEELIGLAQTTGQEALQEQPPAADQRDPIQSSK
jgi:DNA-binding PadR family transcriptional regulator